jgi:hypothetical protein
MRRTTLDYTFLRYPMVARVRARVHGCVRASLRACVRMYGRTCVRPSRYTILTVTQRSMHYNIFSLHRRPYVFITTFWTTFFARSYRTAPNNPTTKNKAIGQFL